MYRIMLHDIGFHPISHLPLPKGLLNQWVVRIHHVLVLRWHAQSSTFAGALLTQIHRPGLVLRILSGADQRGKPKMKKNQRPLEVSGEEIVFTKKKMLMYTTPKKK